MPPKTKSLSAYIRERFDELLPLAEGRCPLHSRPPRGGRLPDRRGAGAPGRHLELDGGALLPGARLRGLPRAPGGGPRRVQAPPRRRRQRSPVRRGRRRRCCVSLDQRVRDRARDRPRQPRRERAQDRDAEDIEQARKLIAAAGRVVMVGVDQMAFFASYLRHLLSLLDVRAEVVASPSQEALAAWRASTRTARDRLLERTRRTRSCCGREAGAQARLRHARDHRREPVRADQACRPLRLYYSSNSPSFTRSHTALLALVQALAYAVYSSDEDAYKSGSGTPVCAEPSSPRRQPRLPMAKRDCGPSALGMMPAMREQEATFRVKTGLAEMLKGGVIMDVTNAEQARIAEEAGACAVMALERVPADIRARRRRGPHGRARQDQRDPGGRDDPGDGQGAHRPLRRGPGAGGARGRLHRRVRGADPGRRGPPHRQVRASRCRSCAAPPTSARRCGASPRARP